MTAELPLRMRLPSREKQGATLPYQVLVEGGETGQSLDGQVRQPAKKKWPILVALMIVALLAAAFLMFKPEDAVAIKDGKADEPITTTVPGAAPPTVPGETTVPGAAPADPAAAAAAATAGPGAAAPGAAAPEGAATTVTTAPAITGPVGGVTPTLAPTTTRPPLACDPKGTPQQTAQRVICAWGLNKLNDVADIASAEALRELRAIPAVKGQTVIGTPVRETGGDRVSFRCVTGGISSVLVSTSTTPSLVGRVHTPIVRCSATAVGPPGSFTS